MKKFPSRSKVAQKDNEESAFLMALDDEGSICMSPAKGVNPGKLLMGPSDKMVDVAYPQSNSMMRINSQNLSTKCLKRKSRDKMSCKTLSI